MSLDNESIVELIDSLDKDSKALKKNLFKLSWYLRGGMTLEEAFTLSFNDREILNSVVDDNIKITNETKLPFF